MEPRSDSPGLGGESQPEQGLQSIIDGFQRLSQRISQDRTVHTKSKDTLLLLAAVVVGEGFIAGKADSDYEEDEENGEALEENSLFVEQEEPLPKGDSVYIDKDGLPDDDDDLVSEEDEEIEGIEEIVQWLNSLKPHIVSCSSETLSDFYQLCYSQPNR